MARRTKQRRQTGQRSTNWVLIGGIIAVGVVALFALLFLSLQTPEPPMLSDYCADNPGNCIEDGGTDSDVIVVEISDYGCSHCRNFHAQTLPLLQTEYIDTERINWVVLPYALSANTLPAANAAMCANEQDAFSAYSEALFARQQEFATTGFQSAQLIQVAEEVGLDVDPFAQCVQSGRYNQIINDNVTAAREAGVTATPTFFVDGRKLEGAQPISVFQQRIEAALN